MRKTAEKQGQSTGKKRGATRMREQGYRLVSLWLDGSELAVLEAARRAAGMPLASYIRRRAFDAAAAERQDESSP